MCNRFFPSALLPLQFDFISNCRDSEGVYRCVDNRHHQWINSCGLSKSMMEGSFLSEDSCCSHGRDLDQISISSTSSIGGPTSRDRRSADIYLPMTPSPGSNNKVSVRTSRKFDIQLQALANGFFVFTLLGQNVEVLIFFVLTADTTEETTAAEPVCVTYSPDSVQHGGV